MREREREREKRREEDLQGEHISRQPKRDRDVIGTCPGRVRDVIGHAFYKGPQQAADWLRTGLGRDVICMTRT